MVKNVLTIVSVLAVSLSLSSYAEAGKRSDYTSDDEKQSPTKKVRPPLQRKQTIRTDMGRKFRPDGRPNRYLMRHVIKELFPAEDFPIQPLQVSTDQLPS